MFRKMRRFRQQLSATECEAILQRRGTGVLAVLGDEGYPYAVPLNYYYESGRFYFHGAKAGHKIDAITHCDKASICVIDKDENVPAEFTTYFCSVIAFGRARIVEDDAEKRMAAEKLGAKFSPDEPRERLDGEIAREWNAMTILCLEVEHMSGKEARELARRRAKEEQ